MKPWTRVDDDTMTCMQPPPDVGLPVWIACIESLKIGAYVLRALQDQTELSDSVKTHAARLLTIARVYGDDIQDFIKLFDDVFDGVCADARERDLPVSDVETFEMGMNVMHELVDDVHESLHMPDVEDMHAKLHKMEAIERLTNPALRDKE